jgi:hypothetical protein
MEERGTMHTARWRVNHWDDGDVSLQIELGAGHSVLLSCDHEDGPSVTIWYGRGEHEFDKSQYPTPEDFSRLLDRIVMDQDGEDYTPERSC